MYFYAFIRSPALGKRICILGDRLCTVRCNCRKGSKIPCRMFVGNTGSGSYCSQKARKCLAPMGRGRELKTSVLPSCPFRVHWSWKALWEQNKARQNPRSAWDWAAYFHVRKQEKSTFLHVLKWKFMRVWAAIRHQHLGVCLWAWGGSIKKQSYAITLQ